MATDSTVLQMSDEELAIAKSVASELHNISLDLADSMTQAGSYGYEVMIKGTMMSGAAQLVCAIISIIFTAFVAKKALGWAKTKAADNRDDAYYVAVAIISVVSLMIGFAVVYLLFYDAFLAIFAPEYVVLSKIMEVVASSV